MASWQTGWRSRLVLLASALLVPLLVAGAFVWAGWKSSDRLHHNQGVVVNLDEPVAEKGATRQLGNQLGAQLVGLSGGQFDWDFGVPADQAQAGLASGRYSVAVVIPKNFTQALLSNGKQRTVLAIQTSPLASVDQKVMANTLAEAAQRGLAKQLGANALSSIYVAFDQVDKDLVTASTKSSSTASAATSLAALAGTAKTQAGDVAAQTRNVATGSQSVAADANKAQQSASDANKSGSAGASAASTAGQAAANNKTQAGAAASGASGLGNSVQDAGDSASGIAGAATGISSASTKLGTANAATGAAARAAQSSAQKYQQAVADASKQQTGLSMQLKTITTAANLYNSDVAAFVAAIQKVPAPTPSATPTAATVAAKLTADANTIDEAVQQSQLAVTYATALRADYSKLYRWSSQSGFNTCALGIKNRDGYARILAAVKHMYPTTDAVDAAFGDQASYTRIIDMPDSFNRLACMLFIDGMEDARADVKTQMDNFSAAQIEGGSDALTNLPASLTALSGLPNDLRSLATTVTSIGTTTGVGGSQVLAQVQAQLDQITKVAQPGLTSAIAAADTANDAQQKALAGLTAPGMTGAVKTDLQTLVTANSAAAQQVTFLGTQLTALQSTLGTLTTSLATAKQQAAAVAKQTASTSTGAAALAGQIQGLQKQLTTASGAGAGQAVQAAKVATGATQLSQAASAAAKSASGLSNTVSKVSTQSGDVSKKASDAASSVSSTSTSVKNQTSQQSSAPGQNVVPGTTATADLARHPNIAWWVPLAAMAMWLGAMAMYMLFRPISSALRSSDAAPGVLVGQALAPGLAVGALQGVIMGAASIGVMHLGASDGVKVMGLMLLMAVAFMAVNFALVAMLGIFGRILAVLLAVVTGLGVVTNALPETFDRIRNLSPISPALNAVQAVAAGAPGAGAQTFHLALWAVGALALVTLLVLRSRLAAAPRVATAFAG